MNNMDLSIVIVNYKSKDKLANCLASLRDAIPSAPSFEVIVIENASGDDLSDLRSQHDFRFISSPRNIGMGGGNNLGINESRADIILILNPDTIVSAEALNLMLAKIKSDETVGLVGPKLLYPDGSLQYSCSRFPGFFMPFLRRTFLGEYFKKERDSFMMIDFDHNSEREVDWLMGSCLMFKKSWSIPEGGNYAPHFDKRYFMYFEDIDLCREVKRHGKKVVYLPSAVVIHDHKRESAKNPWYVALFKDKITWIHIASWLKYFAKWGFLRN